MGVRETYPLGSAVECRYAFSEPFQPTTSDWIGVYRVGWRSHDSYETYLWVQLPTKSGDAENTNREASVTFPADVIPKDSKEFYQFCYVSSAKQVCGVSTPFQLSSSMDDLFEVQDPDDPNTMVIKTKAQMLEDHLVVLKKESLELQKEVHLLQLELDAERASKGKLMEQLAGMARLQDELEEERISKENLHQHIKELQEGLRAERQSNEQLHNQLRAMRDELQADRRVREEAFENQSRGSEERMLESQTGASCEELEEAAVERVTENDGVVGPPSLDNATKGQQAATHLEEDGGGAEAKSLSITERITEDFDDETAEGTASGPPEATNKSEDSLKSCPVCNHQFPAGASEDEITQHVEHHNGQVCPICFMQFDTDYPEENVTAHVNRHLDDSADEF